MVLFWHGLKWFSFAVTVRIEQEQGKPKLIINPFQIIKRFDFSTYIVFTMYLDIVYIYVHSKCNISKFQKKATLEKTKRLVIWNGGVVY